MRVGVPLNYRLGSRVETEVGRRRGVKDSMGRCHGGGSCGELGLPEAGEHANEGDVCHDIVFRCSYGRASDTRVDVSHEVKPRGSTSCGVMNSSTLQGPTTDGTLFQQACLLIFGR